VSAAHGLVLAGVDGCPAGWVAAIRDRDDTLSFRVFSDFGLIAEELEAGRIDRVVIDIPIGLSEDAKRAVDLEAKRLLGVRHVCVFFAPLRPMLDVTSVEASAVRKERLGGWASKQELSILPKVREVDARMSPLLQNRIREGHPEVTAAVLNGGVPITAKKREPGGRRARLALVARELGWAPASDPAHDHATALPRVRGAEPHDVVDALLLLASAIRMVKGTATVLPNSSLPELDARGLRAEMIA
jgi:predicted RNase H-like nuclease